MSETSSVPPPVTSSSGSQPVTSSSGSKPATTSGRKFTVQSAKETWPTGTKARKDALCEKWIQQATLIWEAELKLGADTIYVAWATLENLQKKLSAAYRQAQQSDGGPTGSEFESQFVRPAWDVLRGSKELIAQARKDMEITRIDKDELLKAGKALDEAAQSVEALTKKDLASVLVVRLDGGELEDQYWIPMFTALQKAPEALGTLCPRMMGIQNASKTCGDAIDRDSDHCILLLVDGTIRALATRELNSSVLMVHELTVEPESLQKGVAGLGGALMEYIVREASVANSGEGVPVALLPIGPLAQKFYKHMGFTKGESTWSMSSTAQKAYLAKHRVFAETS